MRTNCRWLFVLFVALMASLGVLAASSFATTAPHVPGPDLPNHAITPGAHFVVRAARICRVGYSASVRDVPESEKAAVFAEYRLVDVAGGYEVDHLVSLEVGGSNVLANLWPEHYYPPWGARTKDRLENKLHRLICAGQLSLASAQRQEAANWIAAYKRYVGGKPGGVVVTATPVTTTQPKSGGHPAGATAKCNDGTFSYSAHHSGSCSHHGGVAVFYN